MTGPTRYVESDGDYQRPETAASRMADLLRRQPRVDAHGRPIPATAADPTVTAVVGGPDPDGTALPATPSPRTSTGGSREPVAAPGTPGTLLERMHAKAQLQLDEPTPPGSVV
jgi:hypothetical protein